MKLVIYETRDTPEEWVDLLNYIAELIEAGNTSGHYPGWELKETDDETDNE
jgi:hypothetical protein